MQIQRLRYLIPLAATAALVARTPAAAQNPCGSPGCAAPPSSSTPSEDAQHCVYDALWTNHDQGLYDPPPGNEIYTIPIRFHAVRRSNGETPGAPQFDQTTVDAMLADLTSIYDAVGMRFYQQGPLDYIDNTNYYEMYCKGDVFDLLNDDAYSDDNAVDVYIVKHMQFNASCLFGVQACPVQGFATYTVYPEVYTDLTGEGVILTYCATPACVEPCFVDLGYCSPPLGQGCVTYPFSFTFVHEIGHYFDLLHTWESNLGYECLDGSNCEDCGDQICDTAADSLDLIYEGCESTGGASNPCNPNQPYDPPVRNIMGTVPFSCRTSLTLEQLARARATLINLRPELHQP